MNEQKAASLPRSTHSNAWAAKIGAVVAILLATALGFWSLVDRLYYPADRGARVEVQVEHLQGGLQAIDRRAARIEDKLDRILERLPAKKD